MDTREEIVYKAKLAEQAERYDGKDRASQGVDCRVDWPLLSPPFPCAGGSKAQVTRFTWICWGRDKMAEFSPLDRLGSRLNNSSLVRSGVYCDVLRLVTDKLLG